MTEATHQAVFLQIDEVYAHAPEGLDDNARTRWAQRHGEVACPRCGAPLWIMRSRRAQNRGYYHLAMCQTPECTFQIDD